MPMLKRLLSPTVIPRRRQIAAWLRGGRVGLFFLAALVGVGSGLGAIAFRFLVFGITWLFTGHVEFGQQGWAPSSHLPWLGLAFFVIVPAVGGLLYGPLVQRFAPEARGHGVPEVMVAVAENGGRIRPQVPVVKALASALTIGTGGSVGREGPIAQIGAALASTLGQRIRVPENRLRILVACGAGGAIAATFNTPLAGLFFGAEIILRTLSIESLFAVMLASMVADSLTIAFFGDQVFLAGFPHGVGIAQPLDYGLIAVLAVLAALVGLLFSKTLYFTEDLCNRLWRGRPEWMRPVVGGLIVGLLLLALPQLYGVGYPVMYQALDGRYALWFLLVLAAGKIVATSLTLGMGGSGGVYAPSLFIGLMCGYTFGAAAGHVFGSAAGSPALYAAIGMAGAFGAATGSPLTALASIVEMTGDYTLTLPVMLTVSIAVVIARRLSYGTIYTTKLLRRGVDIELSNRWHAFSETTAASAMDPLPEPLPLPRADGAAAVPRDPGVPGRVLVNASSPAVFETEPVADVLRDLESSATAGLPVVAEDGTRVVGWISRESIARRVRLELSGRSTAPAQAQEPAPPAPFPGLRILQVEIPAGTTSPAAGWPEQAIPVMVTRHGRTQTAHGDRPLHPGDRVTAIVVP